MRISAIGSIYPFVLPTRSLYTDILPVLAANAQFVTNNDVSHNVQVAMQAKGTCMSQVQMQQCAQKMPMLRQIARKLDSNSDQEL